VLDSSGAVVVDERSARTRPLTDGEARELLRGVRRVIVSRGTKTREIEAAAAKPGDLKGPTGSYRAPMVRRGRTLLVGFNREALERLLRES
jgi:hypothetical protein